MGLRMSLLWRPGAHATPRALHRRIHPQGTRSSQGDSTKVTFQGFTHLSLHTVSVKVLDDFIFSDLPSHDLVFMASFW